MTAVKFYGETPPGIDQDWLPGRLIVIEGTDGVGRTTIISILKDYLEAQGWGVVDSGLRRSPLVGPGIDEAKQGHTLDPITSTCSTRPTSGTASNGLCCPRYRLAWSSSPTATSSRSSRGQSCAGHRVNGLSRSTALHWFPDQVIYLDIDAEDLVLRVLERGFDFWNPRRLFARPQHLRRIHATPAQAIAGDVGHGRALRLGCGRCPGHNRRGLRAGPSSSHADRRSDAAGLANTSEIGSAECMLIQLSRRGSSVGRAHD